MHAFFAPFGIYPNNAIVGGSGSIAPGAALFKRVNRKPGIVVCQHRRRLLRLRPGVGRHHVLRHGPVPQAVGRVAGRRPADHVQLHEQLLRHGRPAAAAKPWACSSSRASARASIPEQMHAERVNGYDPLPVIDAFRRKKQVLAGGPRPGPAGHRHLPHQRPLAFRCFQLPVQGRDRTLAAGRFDPRLPPASWSTSGVVDGGRARQRQRARRSDGLRDVPAGGRSRGQPARRRRIPSWSAR